VSRKLALIVVDALRTDMLEHAVAQGNAPHFAALLERGALVPDCVSSFPTVTPVCCAEIVTGEPPGPLGAVPAGGHWIAGMNWFHRLERRYVEYGNSFEATRAFGLFRTLYDIVYNMNMGHLSPEVDTVFERLADAGVRSACTPFLIYRGRTRHELSLEGLMRQFAVATNFRHATWGPDELFWGELYASRKVPCKPTLARPGTRDEYSACCGRELLRDDLYDFLLFSLPDNDYFSHRYGPERMPESIAHADRCFGELVAEAGGIEEFLDRHAVILMADHAQTEVAQGLDLQETLGAEWHVLQPNDTNPGHAELAVSPTARAGAVYVLAEGRRRLRAHADVRARLRGMDGVDLIAWLAAPDGQPLERAAVGLSSLDGVEAVVERRTRGAGPAAELRFRPGSGAEDRRGVRWDVEGDRGVLALEDADGVISSETYPDPLARLWSALASPSAGDVLVSLEVGWETVDWGGMSHVGGGSHGSLEASDSLVPLLSVGLEPGVEETREQWKLSDVAELVLSHFGIADGPVVRAGRQRVETEA
jgi:Type I phosphodiesterase / nucleotide pyrophosphatase